MSLNFNIQSWFKSEKKKFGEFRVMEKNMFPRFHYLVEKKLGWEGIRSFNLYFTYVPQIHYSDSTN